MYQNLYTIHCFSELNVFFLINTKLFVTPSEVNSNKS